MLLDYGGFSGAHLDFKETVPLCKSYVVASSFRSGSTYLCTSLWETGLLGAPFEYLNYDGDMRLLYFRLGATSPGDYMRKLIARRTTRNGVFGIKAHYHHFSAALLQHPGLVEDLDPAAWILIERRDEVAQAVSLARAFQSRAWLSLSRERRVRLFYSREFIQACLEEIREQVSSWKLWFARRRVEPLILYYEDFVANRAATIAKIVRALGVENDTPSSLATIPRPERQSDEISAAWIQRFLAERETA